MLDKEQEDRIKMQNEAEELFYDLNPELIPYDFAGIPRTPVLQKITKIRGGLDASKDSEKNS